MRYPAIPLCLISLFVAACSSDTDDSATDSSAEFAPTQALGPDAPDAMDGQLGQMARFPEQQMFGHNPDGRYRLHGGGFIALLGDDGLALQGRSGEESVEVSLASWGRAGKEVAVGARDLMPRLGESGGIEKLVSQAAGLREEWRGTPFGIQQIWNLEERVAGEGNLSIQLQVSAPFVETDGLTVYIEDLEAQV